MECRLRSVEAAMGPKRVILCVDDEQNALILRKLVLQKAGYEVLTANSGKAALELLSKNVVDLVLSDQLMPGLSGTQMTQQIKAQYPNLPVILTSGINEIPPDASLADRFLSKIEGPNALCKEIASVLEGS
jgi:CheY-like chemotaxis protein